MGSSAGRGHYKAARRAADRAIAAVLLLATVLLLAAGQALAAPHLLSERQARARAVAILLGAPYGRTPAEVERTLSSVRLVRMGETACGQTYQPLWAIHVVAGGASRVEGDMLLDAVTGKRVCATLPDLD